MPKSLRMAPLTIPEVETARRDWKTQSDHKHNFFIAAIVTSRHTFQVRYMYRCRICGFVESIGRRWVHGALGLPVGMKSQEVDAKMREQLDIRSIMWYSKSWINLPHSTNNLSSNPWVS